MKEEYRNSVMVSVICLAYNHEKYIRKTLDSILEQETPFRYEIVIHDDKSKDNTRNVIEEYVKQYPDIIIPVLEEENQYSKGEDVTNISAKYCSGKYICFCECDDYWCDSLKLKKQVDFMENHLEYAACSASCLVLNESTGELKELYHVDEDIDLTIEDIVSWDNRHYQFASLMFRREYAFLPQEFWIKGVSDYPRALHLRMNGKIRYMSENMSVYRAFSDGSWSSNFASNIGMQLELIKNTLDMLNRISSMAPEDFDIPVTKKIRYLEYQLNLYDNNYPVLVTKYKEFFSGLSKSERIKIKVKYYCPFIYSFWKKIKGM